MRLCELHLLQPLSRHERLASAVEQGLRIEINERAGIVQDEQRLLLPQVECAFFQGLEYTLQRWIGEVAELDKCLALFGGVGEIHEQGMRDRCVSVSHSERADSQPTVKECKACGPHGVLAFMG